MFQCLSLNKFILVGTNKLILEKTIILIIIAKIHFEVLFFNTSNIR